MKPGLKSELTFLCISLCSTNCTEIWPGKAEEMKVIQHYAAVVYLANPRPSLSFLEKVLDFSLFSIFENSVLRFVVNCWHLITCNKRC